MRITLTLNDSAGKPRGTVDVVLDWATMTWKKGDETPGVWLAIAGTDAGRFQVNGTKLEILESDRVLFTLENGPADRYDAFRSGNTQGSVTAAFDATLTGGRLTWSIDVKALLFPEQLSPFRKQLLSRLQSLLDAPYLSKNYDILTGGLRREDKGVKSTAGVYTSCGSMPGFVVGEMARFKGLSGSAATAYIDKYSLNGTNIVRIKGVRYNCWVENDLQKRPKPGDVYALLNKGTSNKASDGISHVGVIQECSGGVWKTMDLGQGSGFDGKKDVTREYRADSGELFGETNQGGGFRVLAGWVDVDEYLKLG